MTHLLHPESIASAALQVRAGRRAGHAQSYKRFYSFIEHVAGAAQTIHTDVMESTTKKKIPRYPCSYYFWLELSSTCPLH